MKNKLFLMSCLLSGLLCVIATAMEQTPTDMETETIPELKRKRLLVLPEAAQKGPLQPPVKIQKLGESSEFLTTLDFPTSIAEQYQEPESGKKFERTMLDFPALQRAGFEWRTLPDQIRAQAESFLGAARPERALSFLERIDPALLGKLRYNELLNFLIRTYRENHPDEIEAEALLVNASGMGNSAIVKALLDSGIDANARRLGKTALTEAVLNHHADTAELLLKHNAQPDTEDFTRGTALAIATLADNKPMVDLLIRYGADVNGKNRAGLSALLVAASNGRETIAHELLSKGANVNSKDELGWTPLIAAAANDQQKLAQLLLEAGADVTARDSLRYSALDYARDSKPMLYLLSSFLGKK